MKPRVVVAHPGVQHSFRLAVALQREGLLQAFLTNLYWEEARQPYKGLAALPVLGPALRAKVERRFHKELNSSLVHDLNPWGTLLGQVFKRMGLRTLQEWWMFADQKRFSIRAANYARRHADVYIGYDTSARLAFKTLRETAPHVLRILDLSHPHVNGYRILEEEKQLLPVWASTIDAPLDRESVAADCLAEYELADHIIVASSFSKRSLMLDGVAEGRITVVPYGVDTVRFSPTPQKDSNGRFQILFLGQVGQRKGIYYLLEAFRELEKILPHVELTIAGAIIDDVPALRSYESDRCRFRGRLSEKEVDHLMRSADVFVFPSLVEGFGLVLLEAMASGVPVIGTPNTAAADIVTEGEDGYVVPVRDVSTLVERLRHMAENPDVATKMGQAAAAKAELFKWSRYEAHVAMVVNGLWAKRPSPRQ